MAIATTHRHLNKTGENTSFFDRIKNLNLTINVPRKISAKEISFFTSQLSLMIEIGAPLNVSLSSIAVQLKNPEFKKAMTGIITEVEEGKLLSAAIGKYPHIFSEVYVSLVKAGENTGQLKNMLDRIVEVQAKQEKFVEMIKKALTYPAILCFVSLSRSSFFYSLLYSRNLPFSFRK